MEEAQAGLRQIISNYIWRKSIGPRTRIFHDLHIAGDDAWELLEKINIRFGTSFEQMRFADYFPDETEALGLYWTRWLGSGRKYRPLTFEHLARVVEEGIWFDPQAHLRTI